MRSRLVRQLSPPEIDLLRRAGRLARQHGVRLFLAGGAARDVALARPHQDWDLVVEGDGIEFARALADKWAGRATVYEPFMTATVRLADGTSFDIATARRERYPYPGSMPQVEPAEITEDLWRRDFSINAIAVGLCPGEWGELLDPTGGMEDLEEKLVRALHPRSFWDDATRIVRAVGFEQRLGFTIEAETCRWIRSAAAEGALTTVSTERLGESILPLLRDPVGPRALQRANQLGVARALGARQAFTRRSLRALEQVPDAVRRFGETSHPNRRAVACLAALLLGRAVTADRVIHQLHLDRFMARDLRSAARFLEMHAGGFRPARQDGELWEQMREADFGGIAALWFACDDETDRRALERYWTHLRHCQPDFDPRTLRELGYPPGPAFGDALRAAVRAKLDRGVDADEQLAVARVLLDRELGHDRPPWGPEKPSRGGNQRG